MAVIFSDVVFVRLCTVTRRPIAHILHLPQKKGMNVPFLRGVSSAIPALDGCSSRRLATTAVASGRAAQDWAAHHINSTECIKIGGHGAVQLSK